MCSNPCAEQTCRLCFHMEGSNADFAPDMDFTTHTEQRHSFGEPPIFKVANFAILDKYLCKPLILGITKNYSF